MIKKNQIDSEWHIGYAKKAEDDPRRHKKHCAYNICDRCQNESLVFYKNSCPGSSHCRYYRVDDLLKREIEKKILLAKNGNKNDSNKSNKSITSRVSVFYGVRSIKIDDLNLTEKYERWIPKQKWIDKEIEHYKNSKKFTRCAIVGIKDDSYFLYDHFMTYYVAKTIGLKYVPCILSDNYK